MRKLIILLLCCGVLISMVGCGGNTAPLPAESPPITVSETITTETLPVTAVEPTEKETVFIESHEQASKLTSTAPLTTKKPTEEAKHSETINTAEEKVVFQVVETVKSTTSQHTEMETTTELITETIIISASVMTG